MKTFSLHACLFGMIALMVAGITACQEQAPEASGPPMLSIVGGDTVDWGEVGGGKLEHQMKLVNNGGDSLNIVEVKPSCGCTATEIDKNLLMPGDTATVGITMDVTGRKGEYTKYVNITSNDSTHGGLHRVTLRAFVIQEIEAEPNYFGIMDVKPGEKGSASITLKNVSDKAITIQAPKPAGSTLVDVSFDMKEPHTLQPGESFEVTATAVALNSAPAPTDFVFETDSEKTPEVHAKVQVLTQADGGPNVSSSTPQISLGGK